MRMKHLPLFLVILMIACNNAAETTVTDTDPATATATIDTSNPVFDPHVVKPDTVDVYQNETFKEVQVKKTGETTYDVTGKARVFEAVYHYLVREGNEVMMDGYGMADAGAPEFGNFRFSIDVKKQVTKGAVYLVIFEVSAKDGSRQHELPILLD